MMDYSKISIITPSFNQAHYIERAILSVVEQSYSNWEYIIIDGGSTDTTLEVLKNYQQYISYWVSEPDLGVFDAMNKGIRNSQGEWLYFLGCDDTLHDKNVLANIFGKDRSGLDVIYGDVLLKHQQTIRGGEFDPTRFYDKLDNIVHQAIFCRRSVYEKVGMFDPKMIVSADYAHNLAWFGHPGIRHQYIHQVVAVYNETGLSSNTMDTKFHEERSILFYKHLGKLIKQQSTSLYLKLLSSAAYAYMIRKSRVKALWIYFKAFILSGNSKHLRDGIYWLKKTSMFF